MKRYETPSNFLEIIPVLLSQDIKRDVEWHQKHTGFEPAFEDGMYAGLQRENLSIHLQWHADTNDDLLQGGSVIKLFVKDIHPIFKEFLKKGMVTKEKLRLNTTWGTNEFCFYHLNHNTIFIVQII